MGRAMGKMMKPATTPRAKIPKLDMMSGLNLNGEYVLTVLSVFS